MEMEVRCIRCEERLKITKEKLDKIKEMQLEELSPQGLLDFLPSLAERCKKEGFKDKKHKFEFSAEYRDEVDNTIKEMENKKIEVGKKQKEFDNKKADIDKITDEIEILNNKLEQERRILDRIKDNQLKISQEIPELFEHYKELTGTDKIEWWKRSTTI